MEKKTKNNLLFGAIILLYAVLFFIFLSSYAFDDLGFDFAGYALRYEFAFSGWIKNILLGVPAGTFDGELPAILPLFLKAIGFGSFTLPVALSVFLLQLAVPIAMVFIGKKLFGIEWKRCALLGLLLVLNPFTFKFMNRYYEFAAWFLFFIAFFFYYKFLDAKFFERKYFAGTVIASCAIVLSHPAVLVFWAIAFVSMLRDFVDLKRFATVAVFVFGLAAFWLLPFFSFSQLSIVSTQQGAELATTGIFAASFFFAFALPITFLEFFGKIRKDRRVFGLFCVASALAIVYAVAPKLPVLGIPFAHSFHFFFFFVLVIGAMQLFKTGAITKNYVIAAGAIAAICLVLLLPVVARQYLFTEPRYSDYDFEKQRINYNEFDALMQKVPKTQRFETLPYDPVISAQLNEKYGLLELRGWGYNAYTLKESQIIGEQLTSMNISCEEFIAGSEKTATTNWIALNDRGEKFLKNCGLKKTAGNQPALYLLESSKAGLVDNAELLEFENKKIKFRALEKSVLVKSAWFPRWHAFNSAGKELQIENAKPGMIIQAQAGEIIELRYENAQVDFAGAAVSIFFFFLFFMAMF